MSEPGSRRSISNEDRAEINAYNARNSPSKLPTRFQGYNVGYLKAIGVLPESFESPKLRDAYKAWGAMNKNAKNAKKTPKLTTTLVTLDAAPFMPVIRAAVSEAMENHVSKAKLSSYSAALNPAAFIGNSSSLRTLTLFPPCCRWRRRWRRSSPSL
jgi:hypothetical protein